MARADMRWWLGLLLSLTACARSREPPRARPTAALAHAAAQVGGDVISLEEVRAACADTGDTPRAALALLVRERLLASYAQQRGYGELPEVRLGVERARVHALLTRAVEGKGSGQEPDSKLPDSAEDVRARREALERLLRQLTQQAHVHYDEAAIQKAFASAVP